MKIPRIINAVGYIDDKLISEATESKQQIKHNSWLKWGSIAACVAVIAIAGAAILPSMFNSSDAPKSTDGRYKDYNIQVKNSAIIWQWEYQTVYERYTELHLDGTEFRGTGFAISENLVDELIGTHTVIGYDEITDEKHTSDFDVYQLKYAAKSQCVAVKMDGAYYVFKNNKYAPPSTLGELFEAVDLSKAVKINSFSQNGDSPEVKHYALSSDSYVWETLASCKAAEFVENEAWTTVGREYISFSITSETLGVRKVGMYITADGYLWTNAFDWQYIFNIGEDTAEKIIKYAKENSTEVPYEPYQNSIAGTITEISDDYIIVDDAVLCNDAADGIAYKILLEDIRISRYVDNGVIHIGDTVQIFYVGEIGNNIVTDVTSLSKAVISEGVAYIAE